MAANYMRVRPMRTPASRIDLPAGRILAPPDDPTHPPTKARQLNSIAIRGGLTPAPTITRNWVLVIHTDLSGSMAGGNDALGLRHEVALIVAEHLAGRRRQGMGWAIRCHSFDDGGTSLDIDRTPLDRKGRRHLEQALLGTTYGGCSNLGPSLDTSIAETASWTDTGIIRIVLSDLELLDNDVPGVLNRFASAPADLNMALVFRASVPQQLEASSVATHRITPDTTSPEDLAQLVMDAIAKTVTSATPAEAVTGLPQRSRTANKRSTDADSQKS